MRYTFTCAEHEEYGHLGWKLSNMPAFDPLGGMGVAHDVLEHRRGDDSTTGELMALGVSMHVRGSDYYAMKGRIHTRPSYHMSGEIGALFCHISDGEWIPLQDTKLYRLSPRCCDHEDIMAEIEATVELVKKHFIEEDRPEISLSAQDEINLRSWLARGYSHALRRYRGIPHYQLLEMFCEIERRADQLLKDAWQGCELIVDVKNRTGVHVYLKGDY